MASSVPPFDEVKISLCFSRRSSHIGPVPGRFRPDVERLAAVEGLAGMRKGSWRKLSDLPVDLPDKPGQIDRGDGGRS